MEPRHTNNVYIRLPIKEEMQEKHTAHLETVIIDTPGKYLTRNGLVVEIDLIKEAPMRQAYGHLLLKTSAGKIKREYNFWLTNGAYRFVGKSAYDVVSKVADSSPQ